jgi:hypothetical protein
MAPAHSLDTHAVIARNSCIAPPAQHLGTAPALCNRLCAIIANAARPRRGNNVQSQNRPSYLLARRCQIARGLQASPAFTLLLSCCLLTTW